MATLLVCQAGGRLGYDGRSGVIHHCFYVAATAAHITSPQLRGMRVDKGCLHHVAQGITVGTHLLFVHLLRPSPGREVSPCSLSQPPFPDSYSSC